MYVKSLYTQEQRHGSASLYTQEQRHGSASLYTQEQRHGSACYTCWERQWRSHVILAMCYSI